MACNSRRTPVVKDKNSEDCEVRFTPKTWGFLEGFITTILDGCGEEDGVRVIDIDHIVDQVEGNDDFRRAVADAIAAFDADQVISSNTVLNQGFQNQFSNDEMTPLFSAAPTA